MEEIAPGVFIDGGHNADGIDAFIESVSKITLPEGGKKISPLFRSEGQTIWDNDGQACPVRAVLRDSHGANVGHTKKPWAR